MCYLPLHPQHVDFVISMQFLAILPKLSFPTPVDPILEPL